MLPRVCTIQDVLSWDSARLGSYYVRKHNRLFNTRQEGHMYRVTCTFIYPGFSGAEIQSPEG